MPAFLRRYRLPIFFLALIAMGFSQTYSDNASKSYTASVRKAVLYADSPNTPSVNTLAFFSLGDRPLAADLMWIWMIQYFGSGVGLGKYPSLGPILERITTLDEHFAYPYQFAMIVLPFTGQAETAARLGEKAITVFPNDGLLTYYLATVYHLNLRQYDRAALLYEKASTLEGSPTASKRLAEITRAKAAVGISSDTVSAKAFWQAELEKARNDTETDRATRWLIHTEIVNSVEIASRLYLTKTGQYPSSLQQLVDAKFLPQIPVSPVGRTLSIRSDGSVDDNYELVGNNL